MGIFNKTIKLSMDYAQFDGSITDINRKMKQLDSEFKLAKENAKAYGDEQTQLELDMQHLAEKIELQTKKVNASKEAYENATTGGKATDKQLDKLKQSYLDNQVSLAKMNNELKNCKDKLDSNTSSADEATESNNKLDDSLQKGSTSAADYAGQLYIVQQALDVIKQATEAYVDFDTSLSKVNTLADKSVTSMSKLKAGIYDIAKQTGKSATDISDALYEAISANVKTEDSLKVTLAAANLAKTGFTDTATAVNVLTTIMNSYQMSADEVVTISDKLLKVQDLGKTTVGEFGDSFGKVAGLAKEAGVQLDEVLASVSTLTKVNGSASESITGLKAAISNIIKPSAEASELAKKLGINFNASALQSEGFAAFLQDVQKKSHGNIETMAKLFGSVEALNTVLVLTGSGADSFSGDLSDIQNASGKTEESLNDLKGTGNNFKDSLVNLQTTLLQIGDALSPVIDLLSGVFNVISNIPGPILKLITVGLLLVGAIKAVTAIKAAMTKANIALGISEAILGGASLKTAGSMIPLLLVITAIVAVIGLVIGGAISIGKALDNAANSTKNLANEMSNVKNVEANVKTNYTASQYNASGTDNFPGGRTWINEGGPEEVILPSGSKIIPHDKVSNGQTNIYNVTLNASTIKDLEDIKRLCEQKKQTNRRGVQANG
ncbi:phage tail tape measure protein, TP901 family, core region [Anaerosporobacter mobilis DSM 15930]|uniref:Phage tail tape measure protein, TP901 family, core region n=1 Tax=Anaerosporobacter mobilis DSM 15930 TaxID=1120996 RepID=A0A1M7NLF5_9FIRM|nr:phage tail tape measure protein [Anaerosporobacter mobilis]SHN04162.1 phage tail tape measure protein, TP901 family, core region [Anaerosporobacter mobilis DSM 15930]